MVVAERAIGGAAMGARGAASAAQGVAAAAALFSFAKTGQNRGGRGERKRRRWRGSCCWMVADGGSELLQLIGGDWRGELQLLLRLWIAAIGEGGVADPLSVCCF